MSDLFNAKRFALLLRKTIAEKPMQTIGVAALLLVLSVILYAIVKKMAGFDAAQKITFFFGLAIGTPFLASFVFGYFNRNAIGCSYLTLPVSYVEKWLSGILIAGIFYPVIFLLVYHLTDVVFVSVYHSSLDPNSVFYKQQYERVYTFDLNNIVAWRIYGFFLFYTGAMFVGGLYFNKTAFIKTAIVVTVLFLLIMGMNWVMATLLFQHVQDAAPYNRVSLSIGKETGTLALPTRWQHIFYYGLAFVLPIGLWFLPLIRFREKEF
ncbi:hypothetical protein [Niabella sp.]|uniref:hypothetical protein n=1 Tax=Niabella sp. TaxID=1962976 RepID=UPI0026144357|nr:hypothetical protein [Niabella sp.]